jgi:16S rRNA G966 N2-methylase RsmD
LVGAVIAAGTAAPVDLVLADPPYDVQASEIEGLLSALAAHGWVSEGTVVVVERATSGPTLSWPPGWQPWQQRVYGDTRLELAERL